MPYAAWSLPSVAGSAVVRAESGRGRQRRIPAAAAGGSALPAEGLERELAASLRTGGFSPGVSARDLEAIVAAAVDEARREGFATGHDEGYAAGERAGREDGLAGGRRHLQDAAGRFAGLLEALQAPLLGQEQALREALLATVVRITRAVLRVETCVQPGHIATVVEEALAALPAGARNVRVFVSAADHELLEDFGGGEAVPALLVDAALGPGDCRVETDDSLVDFTQSARFEEIIGQFLGRAQPGGAG